MKIRPREGEVYFDVVAVVDPVTRDAQKVAPLLLVRSHAVRSGLVRSGPVRFGPVLSGPVVAGVLVFKDSASSVIISCQRSTLILTEHETLGL